MSPVPIRFAIAGPTSATVGVAVTFSITPTTSANDTITPSDDSGGGTFSPTSITFTNSDAPLSFTYTPASNGTKSISISSGLGAAVTGSPISLVVSDVGFIFSGPSGGTVGSPVAFTVSPLSTVSDTITFSDSGGGGTFYPSSLQITNSALVQTFGYVPGSSGIKTLTLASSDGGIITGSPLSLSVSTLIQKPTKKWFGGLHSRRSPTRFN